MGSAFVVPSRDLIFYFIHLEGIVYNNIVERIMMDGLKILDRTARGCVPC
jgi:hypothetical protein